MAYFPLFINLEGKRCIIIGDGPVAKRKAASLELFEAEVTMYGEGEWQMKDLLPAFLVIAATNDRVINKSVAQYCREHKIFVNVADAKEESDFLFPSVIKRGTVSIGISTEGGSPLLASEIRKGIEEELPSSLEEISASMAECRAWVKSLPIGGEKRRLLFHEIYQIVKEKKRKLKKGELREVVERLLGEEYGDIDQK